MHGFRPATTEESPSALEGGAKMNESSLKNRSEMNTPKSAVVQ